MSRRLMHKWVDKHITVLRKHMHVCKIFFSQEYTLPWINVLQSLLREFHSKTCLFNWECWCPHFFRLQHPYLNVLSTGTDKHWLWVGWGGGWGGRGWGALVVLWLRLVLPTWSYRIQVPPVSGHISISPLFNLSALEFTQLCPIKWGGVLPHPSEGM